MLWGIFMGRAGLIATVLVLTGMIGGAAGAQNLRDPSPPSEQPPESFSGTQFVDSRGCVYVRAGLGGTTNWVPRVNRERKQLCGFEPTLTAMAAPTPAPQPAPAADSARTAAAPTRSGSESEPAADPTPRVLREPAPEAERPRRRISRAEACAGRSGIQPNMISARTGDPVDCGPPEVPAEAAAEPVRPTLTRAQACAGRSGVQPTLVSARTGEPIDCGPAPRSQRAANAEAPAAPPRRAGPRRMTMAELCAEQARTDRRFVNARTGRPVSCTLPGATPAPAAAQPRGRQIALSRPPGGYATPLDRAPGTTAARPGPAAGRPGPGAYSNPLDQAPGSTGTAQPIGTTQPQVARANTGWVFGAPAPYSNPPGARQDITPAPPEGYETAWTDGRLNPDRGLPDRVRYATRTASSTASPSPAPAPSAGEAPADHSYVKVRTFNSRAAAQEAARGLRDRGLPMRIGVYTRGGTEYRMVLAGPFASNSGLRHALATARGAGYPGATTRR
jgi:hypothetical protein